MHRSTTQPYPDHSHLDQSHPDHPHRDSAQRSTSTAVTQDLPRSADRSRHALTLLGVIFGMTSLLTVVIPTAAYAVSATPQAPPGAAALQDLLNWTLYGGAIACTATAMYGFAKMGISHTQQSFQGANHGKSIAILGLLGALGLGLTPTIVNALTAIH